MRFKVDEILPRQVAEHLRAKGYDASTVHEQGMTGFDDGAVAEACREESRCIVTLDLDFADVRRFPPRNHAGILVFRLHRRQKPVVLDAFERVVETLSSRDPSASLRIVEKSRIRIWPARTARRNP